MQKFDEMPDDCESNALVREAEGIHKAGNYALRMMRWLISDKYIENFNYYDLNATASTLEGVETECYRGSFLSSK